MLLISRLNLSYLNLLPLPLILPVRTAVKSLAPSSQWSTNADQAEFLACLQLIRNLFDSPWPLKDNRALLRLSTIVSAPLDAAQWVLWTYMCEVSSRNLSQTLTTAQSSVRLKQSKALSTSALFKLSITKINCSIQQQNHIVLARPFTTSAASNPLVIALDTLEAWVLG